LVVDDDPDVRETVADAVEGLGRRVFTARDGSEALELLDGPSVPRPCLILADWLMTPMNGESFLARLATRPDAGQLPTLIISGSDRVLPSELPAGVLAVLQKPFGFEELYAALGHYAA
jgi:CheY-like chemotaxis protein